MPDNPVALQADLVAIPGAIGALGALAPILRALSADGASPLAFIQLEAIGSKFPISGELAKKTVDALTNSGSFRLRSLQVSIGWMKGDTSWALSQTAGGQAAALLTLGLVEMFCKGSTGHLLFELSTRILHPSQRLSNMDHLSELSQIVSEKMKSVCFGQHHADQVTRIRMTYLNSEIEIPRPEMATLLNRITVPSMVDILDGAQLALREDTTTLRIEGFAGMAGIVSILTSLFADDILLLVENEVIFSGRRNSIVISVLRGTKLGITLEKVLHDRTTSSPLSIVFRKDEFLAHPGRVSSYDRMTMKTEGCLGSMVTLVFDHQVLQSKHEVIVCLGNLVGAILLSFDGSDCGPMSNFPKNGLRSLLGIFAESRVREQLSLLFGVQLNLSCVDAVSEYHKLRAVVSKLIPDSDCTCSQCPNAHSWADMFRQRSPCYVRSIWGGLQAIAGYAIVLAFVNIECDLVRLPHEPKIKAGSFFCSRLIQKVQKAALQDPKIPLPVNFDEYTVADLHNDLCQLVGSKPPKATEDQNFIGTSSGAMTIFPSTLQALSFDDTEMVRYTLLDGHFHDGINYYKALIEDSSIPPRPETDKSLQPNDRIGLSNIGIHSDLTMTVRPFHNSFGLRTAMQVGGKVINLSFYALQMAYMGIAVAPPCAHVQNTVPPPPYYADSVVATGVEAPLASRKRFSVALVHGDHIAQFLAGVENTRSLFQGSSCLHCAMEMAQLEGYQLLIQS